MQYFIQFDLASKYKSCEVGIQFFNTLYMKLCFKGCNCHPYIFYFTSISLDGEDLHAFELNLTWKGSSHLFGVPGPTERRIWMQKILESATSAFPVRLLTEYTKAGWCFLKV
jgi:hypothetical protein